MYSDFETVHVINTYTNGYTRKNSAGVQIQVIKKVNIAYMQKTEQLISTINYLAQVFKTHFLMSTMEWNSL